MASNSRNRLNCVYVQTRRSKGQRDRQRPRVSAGRGATGRFRFDHHGRRAAGVVGNAEPSRVGVHRQAVALVAARGMACHHRAPTVTDDWFEFLVALLNVKARFLVIGAHALAAHGVPRATQDLDVWVDPAPQNAELVWAALLEFGAPAESLGIRREDLSTSDTVIQFGVPPNRIDILTSISGVPAFEAAWKNRVDQPIRNRTIPILGRTDFIANKRATARHRDLADIEALGERA